jgi:hypothetical protein
MARSSTTRIARELADHRRISPHVSVTVTRNADRLSLALALTPCQTFATAIILVLQSSQGSIEICQPVVEAHRSDVPDQPKSVAQRAEPPDKRSIIVM